ncbi:MAG TPA: helix-turn-helix domain-containing protein [Thermomicrobiaceae bacterium]|nr:helix-turn-helix domain-containing protein [Thermomicrobiaceae bacterium]
MSSSSKSNLNLNARRRRLREREPAPTPGGARLRAVRERAGRTQLWVEAEAELGTGYLQRIESGRVRLPVRATLERILDALGARYSERREVLELFGYAVATPLPDEDDIAWALLVSRHELDDFPFPAYVLDCTHRLIAWNRLVPRLFGLRPDGPQLARLARRSIQAAWFDTASPLARLVAEPDSFLPALIRAMRYEMRPFRGETWYAGLLDQLLALPRFRHHWTLLEEEPSPVTETRAVMPLRLNVPGAGTLLFRLSAERFALDARFRVIYYFPSDEATMRQCVEWGIQETSERAAAETTWPAWR